MTLNATLIKIIFNIYFYTLFFQWTIIVWFFAPIVIVLMMIIMRASFEKIFQRYVRYYGWGVVKLIPFWAPVKVEDQGGGDVEGAVIYVSNHCSSADPFLFGALSGNMIFVTSWPFEIPVINIFMKKGGYIDSRKGWETLKNEGKKMLSKGTSIIIWPEGHRSKDGYMKRFYPGAFHLSQHTGRPIVPVAVFGTHKLLPPKKRFLTPSRIKMVLLPPVWPKDFTGEDSALKMKKAVKTKLAETLGQYNLNQ